VKNKPDIERVLDRWFEEGPTVVPDRVLESALESIDETKQRRLWDVSGRYSPMSNLAKIAVAGVFVLAVGAVAIVLADRSSHPPVGSASESPGPSASAQPTASAPKAATFSVTGSMTAPHEYHTATLLVDGKVLVAGGDSYGEFATSTTELYDPSSGTWSATGSLETPRQYHTATRLADGRVLIAGGFIRGNGAALASAELYDPSSGSWTATGNMITARWGQTATLLPDGRVLVAGGCTGVSDFLSSAELYDPHSGTWAATGSMVAQHCGHTATLLQDGKVLVAGLSGSGGSRFPSQASAELYDPSSGTWSVTGNLVTERLDHSATLLADGRVLVAGGNGVLGGEGYDVLGSAELYDPVTGKWRATGSMSTPRLYAAASLLADGRVLMTGGNAVSGDTQDSAEIYDPVTGTWTVTAVMSTPRHSHTATLLNDGRVLVTGGEPAGPAHPPLGQPATLVFLDSAELYVPGP
jgi:hypothetical protein